MKLSPSQVVALRATYVHYPRDGALASAPLAQLAGIAKRWRDWHAVRRRAFEAERWIETASDRDLADIGLTRRSGRGFHGVPPGYLHTVWGAL